MNEAEESLGRATRRELTTAPTSFELDAELRKKLRDPFPPELIGKLPKTAKRPALDYVGHAAVTDRLNQVVPGWTWEPVEWVTVQGADGMTHLQAVIGKMTIGGVTRYEVGEVEKPSTFGDEAKKAVSNFIRRAAMRYGVALDLWAKEDLSSGAESRLDDAPDYGAAVAGNDESLRGEAASDPAAATPQSVGESTDAGAHTQVAEAAQDAASPATVVNGSKPEYLTSEEVRVLAKVYGNQKKLMDAARERYGDHIRRAADITREQGQELAKHIQDLADGY